VITSAWAVTGIVAVGATLAAVAGLLAVWAVGYVTMARRVTNAGALYTFVAHGFGSVPAVAASFVQALAYTFMQVGLYGIGGYQARVILGDLTGINAPWWAWALVAWALVAVLGTQGVGLSSKILGCAVIAELVIVGIISIVALAHPAGGQVSFAALDPSRLDVSGLGVALAISVTAYIGVEAAPVYSEESKRPKSTVLVATFLALALMTLTYTVGSWAMTVIVGPDQVIDTATRLGPDMLLIPASQYWGGQTLVNTGHLLLLTSIGVGLVAYHNAFNRTAFALGREHVLPEILGRTSPTSGAPIAASMLQSICGLATITVVAMTGWDPMTGLFYVLGTTGGLGVFLLMTAASGSVLGFFARNPSGESIWATRILPAIATTLMIGCTWLIFDNYATLIGATPTSPARWTPLAFAAVGAAGLGYGLWLRVRRPDILNRVGHGANAALLDTKYLVAVAEVAR
jgi:amino acid transporter